MKKWLLAAGLGLALATSAQAADKIAIVNMAKMKKLQSMKAGSDRTKLEKDVMAQRQTFAQKAQAFEQDRARRSNEERGKLVTRIQTAVKSVANSQDIDLVVDANAVAYNSSDVKDITADVLKQVK